jgi:hypothetical protein
MTGTDWLIVPIIAVAALVVLRKLFAGKSKKECGGCSSCSQEKTTAKP